MGADDGHAPKVEARERPSFPLLLPAVVASWAMLAAVERAAWDAYVAGEPGMVSVGASAALPALAAVTTAVIVMAAIAARSPKRRNTDAGSAGSSRSGSLPILARQASLCIVAAAAACICGVLCWQSWESRGEVLAGETGMAHSFVVISDPHEGAYGSTSNARVTLAAGGSATVRINWPKGMDPLPMGMRFSAFGSLARPKADDSGRWHHRSCTVGSISPRGVRDVTWRADPIGGVCRLRLAMSERIGEVEGPGGALLAGVTLGDRTRIAGTQLEEDYRLCGLSHLVAVSGSHLALVAGLVLWVLTKLGVGHAGRFLGTVLPVVGYAVLTGLAPSALRALVMLVVALASGLAGRRADPGSGLSLCALGMLLANPSNAFSLGFALSSLSVLGLVTLMPLVAGWVSALMPRVPRWIADPLAMTLTAQLVTAPVTIPAFSTLSLVAPVANVACGPLVSAIISAGVPFALLSCVPVPPLRLACAVALRALGAVGALSASIAHGLGSLPMASVALSAPAAPSGVLGAAVAFALWALWPQPPRRVLAAATCAAMAFVLVAFAVPWPHAAQVVALDVGQGDAILIRQGTNAVLVDTGPPSGDLPAALARNGVKRLDAVVVTHLHDDHYGGLSDLYGSVPVGHVIVAQGVLDLAAGDTGGGGRDAASAAGIAREVVDAARQVAGDSGVIGVSKGDLVSCGPLRLKVLSPQAFTDEGGNDDSLVMLLSTDADGDGTTDVTTLLTGDAEAKVVGPVVDEAGLGGGIDVLKVGHHGSRVSMSDGLAEKLRPKVALVSCGAHNRYGHPSQECLDALGACGTQVLRTDRDGDAVVDLAVSGPQASRRAA